MSAVHTPLVHPSPTRDACMASFAAAARSGSLNAAVWSGALLFFCDGIAAHALDEARAMHAAHKGGFTHVIEYLERVIAEERGG